MIKSKKLLSILLLFLVSLTAVAATVALNVSVTTDVVNGSHGTTVNGILTFTNNGSTDHTIDIVASSTNTNITFGNIAQTTVTNNSTSTAEYTLLISQFTPAGTYNYTIDYNETTDTNSATFQIEVLSDNTITETINNDEITTQNSTQDFVLSLNNIGNTQGSITNISFPTLTLNWDETVNLTATTIPNSTISVSSNDIQNATATYTTNVSSEYGDYSGILKYNDENGALVEETITMRVYEDSYNAGLEITANFEDITNDDDDTYPGDTVRIEDIEINNEYTDNDDDSVNDIELEYRIYFVTDGDEILDETYSETFDLEENDDSNLNDIDFQIPFDAEEGDYVIELIVTGEVESDGSDDGDEISNRLYLEFNVEKESRHMIPKDLIADSYCPGETAELNIELANIGTDDLDEDDDMMIRVKISSFDYDQWHNYTEDIDEGDIETILINVDIPSNVETGNQYNSPIDLELRPGALCNLKCRMCGPHSSTQIQKEIGKNPDLFRGYDAVVEAEEIYSEKNLNFLLKNINKGKQIKFLGGEPTIMPEVSDILDKLIATDNTNVRIHITTNCTNTTEQFMNKLKQFTRLSFNYSVDGTDKIVEYIRHPVKFNTINNNLRLYKNIAEDDNISFVLQAYNLFNLYDTIKWAADIEVRVHTELLQNPNWCSVLCIPKEIRDKELYKTKELMLNEEYSEWITDPNTNIIPAIDRLLTDNREFGLTHLARNTKILDKVRHQHIKDYIPELWEIMKEEYNNQSLEYIHDYTRM